MSADNMDKGQIHQYTAVITALGHERSVLMGQTTSVFRLHFDLSYTLVEVKRHIQIQKLQTNKDNSSCFQGTLKSDATGWSVLVVAVVWIRLDSFINPR